MKKIFLLILAMLFLTTLSYAFDVLLKEDNHGHPLIGIDWTVPDTTARDGSDSYFPVPVRTLRALNVHDSGTVTVSNDTDVLATLQGTSVVYDTGLRQTLITYDTGIQIIGTDTYSRDTALYWVGQTSLVTKIILINGNNALNDFLICDTNAIASYGSLSSDYGAGLRLRIWLPAQGTAGREILDFNPPLRFLYGVYIINGYATTTSQYTLVIRK